MSNENNIQKGLEQSAQQIVERIPAKWTDDNILIISEALQKFMEENDFNAAKVARWIGYSRSVVTEFSKGKYKGNNERIANKIVNLINSVHLKKKQVKEKRFIPTTVARRIGTLIKQTEAFCDDEGKIGLIIGDGGHGKSYCLRQYSEADQNTIYVELDNTMSSSAIFAKIAAAIKVGSVGSLAAISERLIDLLLNRHTLIMLDEASALTVKQLNQLRQIIVVKSKCPLVLAGNKNLLDTIMQPPTNQGCNSLDQFTSRLVQVLNLDKLAIDNNDDLYTIKDVRDLYEYGGIRIASGGVNTLRRICKTPNSGRLRTCNHIISALHTSRVVEETRIITAELIVAAIEELDLPIKERLPVLTADINDDNEPDQKAVAAG